MQRIDDGEVSPYLTEELRAGDELELRGPIGGYFNWRNEDGGPLLLIARGSGLVPLMAMLPIGPPARAPSTRDCSCRPARSRTCGMEKNSGSSPQEAA